MIIRSITTVSEESNALLNAIGSAFSLFLISILLSVSLCAPAYAEENNKLVFAGFAFSGNYENRQSLYPYSAVISQETVNNAPLLDKILREKLLARPSIAARVSLDLADHNHDSITAVAFALVHENVEFQKVDGKYLVVITMQANVLAFNRGSGSIVASYPLRMRVPKIMDAIPSEQELHSMIRDVYVGGAKDENIFDYWLSKLEKVNIKNGPRKYIQVTDVLIAPEAESVIVNNGKSLKSIKNQIANLVEGAISDQGGVPIVPNSVGEAIGSKIAYRFLNAEALNLDLPTPDYWVTFTIRDFVSKTLEKPTIYQDIYRVKAAISVKQPDLGKTYLDENIYNTLFINRSKAAGVELTSWDQYYKTLQKLIFTMAEQMSDVDEKWLRENASRGLAAKPGFLQTKQLLQEFN